MAGDDQLLRILIDLVPDLVYVNLKNAVHG